MVDLFKLVQSLGGTEYLQLKKLFSSSRKESPKYLELMQAIRKQASYNETELLKKFRREKFVKQFPVIKNYLYHATLDGLTSTSITTAEEFSLTAKITKVKILRNKGLYEAAIRELNTALQEAANAEAFWELIELLSLQRYFIVNKFTDGAVGYEWNSTQTQEAIEKYQNLLHYQKLNSEYTLMVDKSFHVRSADYMGKINSIIDNEWIADERKARSQRALFELLITKILFYNITDNRPAFFETALRAVTIAENSIWLNQYDKLRLLSVYPQLMHAAYLTGNTQVISDCLHKLALFKPNSPIQEMAVFSYSIPFSLIQYQLVGQTDNLKNTITSAYKQLKTYGDKLRFDIRLQIIVSCMSGLLQLGNYEEALDWALLYNEYDTGERLDAHLIITMMELIARSELQQHILVIHFTNALYQRALRWGEKGTFEDAFISFFKRYGKAANRKQFQELVSETLQKVNQLKTSDIASNNRTLLPIFKHYLEAKIANLPYHIYMQTSAVSSS